MFSLLLLRIDAMGLRRFSPLRSAKLPMDNGLLAKSPKKFRQKSIPINHLWKYQIGFIFLIQSQPKSVRWNLSRQQNRFRQEVQRYDLGKCSGSPRVAANSRADGALGPGRRQRCHSVRMRCRQLDRAIEKVRLHVPSSGDVAAHSARSSPARNSARFFPLLNSSERCSTPSIFLQILPPRNPSRPFFFVLRECSAAVISL